MSKQVQIPYELFIDLIRYFNFDNGEDLKGDIKKALNEKMGAIARREMYSKYKTAATEEEREEARQQYLDEIGLDTSFRW
jgi:hypothetical protein